MNKPIYLDYNATTPHDPGVIAAMQPYIEEYYGNPSSSHWYGRITAVGVRDARRQVASLLNCRPDEIVFTSGGTEANNYAIRGIANTHKEQGNHIITTVIEHPAVLEVCRYLEKKGFEVSYLPVDRHGMVNVSDVKAAITPRTILITIMHANNEVGTIQPIEQISALAEERGIIVHTDAAQSVGKIQTHVDTLGVDLLSIAGHKLYAPKGIGALYIRRGIQLEQLLHGAGQEKDHRAGTENVTHIIGLGKACEIAAIGLDQHITAMKTLRELLHSGLEKQLKHVQLNGHPEKRLPNTLSLSFFDMAAQDILTKIDADIAASAGAACHSDGIEISHVLKAMNVPLEWAKGTIRFSVGRMTSAAEVAKAVSVIAGAVIGLQTDSRAQ